GNQPRFQIEDLTLRHGEAALRVSGRFGPKWQLDLDARTENFTLADFDRAERAHLSGPLRATAHLGGVPEHPRLDAALQFTEGMADEADLGEGELKLRIDDKAMTWNATIGTHRVSGHDGKLDLRLGASIDGRVLPGLLADVEHASGTYLIQATVNGTVKNPTVLGNIRIEDGAGSLRGLPVAARALNGSISFSQDALV